METRELLVHTRSAGRFVDRRVHLSAAGRGQFWLLPNLPRSHNAQAMYAERRSPQRSSSNQLGTRWRRLAVYRAD